MPANNVAITGNVEAIMYRIDYIYNDANEPLPENVTGYTIESSQITLVNPARDWYDFIGWSGTNLE
jgi:hypothetical protein